MVVVRSSTPFSGVSQEAWTLSWRVYAILEKNVISGVRFSGKSKIWWGEAP